MTTRSARTRAAAALAVAAALSATAVAGTTATATPVVIVSPGLAAESATGTDDTPVLGQALVLGNRAEGTPMVLSVHGVRRVAGGAIVYYSAGFPHNADGVDPNPILATGGSLGLMRALYRDYLSQEKFCDTAVIDQTGRLVYGPTGERLRGYDGKLCSRAPYAALGEARVAAVAVAPIPDDVSVVDVSIGGTLIPQVPVQDGVLLPAAEDTSEAPLLGMGWPELDHAAMAAEDPATYTYPLTQAISDLEGEITDTINALELSGDVLFPKNSATINPDGTRLLQDAADALRDRNITGTLLIIGHTDSDGTDADNQTLSEQRATAVATALTPLLDPGITITTRGRGETEPIASNNTDEGKTLNRRVTLDFTSENTP